MNPHNHVSRRKGALGMTSTHGAPLAPGQVEPRVTTGTRSGGTGNQVREGESL